VYRFSNSADRYLFILISLFAWVAKKKSPNLNLHEGKLSGKQDRFRSAAEVRGFDSKMLPAWGGVNQTIIGLLKFHHATEPHAISQQIRSVVLPELCDIR
jgi:hypothetical protein